MSKGGNMMCTVQTKMIAAFTPKAFLAVIYAVIISNGNVIIYVWTVVGMVRSQLGKVLQGTAVYMLQVPQAALPKLSRSRSAK
eukprot:3162462-Amphidinium_carterae.1